MNPYSAHKVWSPETHLAYQSMPKNSNGHVVSLFFQEGRELQVMREKWKEWAKVTPKSLWPLWIPRWIEHCKVKTPEGR